jgi:hypothetical protein
MSYSSFLSFFRSPSNILGYNIYEGVAWKTVVLKLMRRSFFVVNGIRAISSGEWNNYILNATATASCEFAASSNASSNKENIAPPCAILKFFGCLLYFGEVFCI